MKLSTRLLRFMTVTSAIWLLVAGLGFVVHTCDTHQVSGGIGKLRHEIDVLTPLLRLFL